MKAPAVISVMLLWREVATLSMKHSNGNTPTRRIVLDRMRQSPLIAVSAMLLIADQAPARNLPEVTVSTEQAGTLEALIPIARLRQSLDGPVAVLPFKIPRDEQAFKRLFDAYSDPVSYKQKFLDQNAFLVYYTKGFDGPNRAGIEDDLPEKQALQYGARNEAWIAWEELQAELAFQSQFPDEDNDVEKWFRKLLAAFDAYLQLAQPDDVKRAMASVMREK